MNETMGRPYSGTFCANSAVISGITGQTATTFSTTPDNSNKLQYCIKGKAYQKAAVSGGTTPVVDVNTGAAFVALAASQACCFIYGFDSGGTIRAAQGPIVALDANNGYVFAPEFPPLPDTVCPFAYVVCKNGSTGSAWTFGTSNWDATGMTATPVNVLTLPARPQTS